MGSLRVGFEGVYSATLVCGILGESLMGSLPVRLQSIPRDVGVWDFRGKLDGFFAGKASGYTARLCWDDTKMTDHRTRALVSSRFCGVAV